MDAAPAGALSLPRLRREVTIEQVGASFVLRDASQRFEVAIDPEIARMIPHIDGTRTSIQIAMTLAAQGIRASPAAVASAVETLDGMFLLDNDRGRARAEASGALHAAAVAAPVAKTLQVLRDDRFDCHACGYCCS